MQRERIAVTGMGIVSALGGGLAATWDGLDAGRSGLGALSLFESPRCAHFPVGEVREELSRSEADAQLSRSDLLARYAGEQAWEHAGFEALSPELGRRCGLVLGGCTGGMLRSESFLRERVRTGRGRPGAGERHEICRVTELLAHELGLEGGFRSTVSTACTSGTMAIATACDVLRSGSSERILAGGCDSLTRLTLHGFASLLVMAPDGCRPFDAERRGMSLGEGAAFLALEKESAARARGVSIHGFIEGWGISCDAHHATAPKADGSGPRKAIERALEMAGLRPGQVDYINAHGTGTKDNDIAEARAFAGLFGETMPAISSTKRYFGHSLAAAGAIEAVVCLLALAKQRAPGTLGLREPDPELGIAPLREAQSRHLRIALNCSLGFGGGNTAMLFSHPDFEAGR